MAYQLEENVPEDVNNSYDDNFGISFSKKFLNIAHSYRVTALDGGVLDYNIELQRLREYLLPKLKDYMSHHSALKLHLTLYARFEKKNTNPPGLSVCSTICLFYLLLIIPLIRLSFILIRNQRFSFG